MLNKIFKELSLEAGGSFYPDINPMLQQKFAELIVRECIRALDKADGSVHHSECLLTHFGESLNERY